MVIDSGSVSSADEESVDIRRVQVESPRIPREDADQESSDIRRVQVGSPRDFTKQKETGESSEESIETKIQNHFTDDSSDIEDVRGVSHCRDIKKKHVVMDTTFQEVFRGGMNRVNSEDTGDTGGTFYSQWEHNTNHTLYISIFATFGAVIRIYMGRLFGVDCESGSEGIDDFLTPFSSGICVTASGKTDQTGGALFSDLPSNILGSFIIGVLSPAVASGHPLPWFRKDHRLQHHEAFHTALKVGLCGCLTTCKLSPACGNMYACMLAVEVKVDLFGTTLVFAAF
jgi:fluoride ion exporter CrcB/FEX